MSEENIESEEVKRLKAELAFSEEMRRNEAIANQERIKAVRESSKFYNTDGFWLLFWILIPLVFLGLGWSFTGE
jgi:hypothetical protein